MSNQNLRSRLRPLIAMTLTLACATAITACSNRRGEGPAERVGQTMDKGVATVGRGVEKTGDAIEDAAEGR